MARSCFCLSSAISFSISRVFCFDFRLRSRMVTAIPSRAPTPAPTPTPIPMLRPEFDLPSSFCSSFWPDRFAASDDGVGSSPVPVPVATGAALLVIVLPIEEAVPTREEAGPALGDASPALAEATCSPPSSFGILILFDTSASAEAEQHALLSPQHQYSDLAVPSQGVNCETESARF